MKKIIALVSGLTFLLQAMPAMAAPSQQQKTKTFAQWCQQKDAVPAATKLTIDLLLKEAGTQNCQQADSYINSLTEINLSGKGLSDLQPLSSFTKLTGLYLDSNKISDLKPLAGLTKLIGLQLSNNKISNVRPLAGLIQLNTLYLQNNQIVDARPLSKLSKLDSICLFNNRITDKKLPLMNREDACKL
jgi:internalin A